MGDHSLLYGTTMTVSTGTLPFARKVIRRSHVWSFPGYELPPSQSDRDDSTFDNERCLSL